MVDMLSSLFISVIATFITDESIDYWKGFVLLFYLAAVKLV
jgi:hypothetical protein